MSSFVVRAAVAGALVMIAGCSASSSASSAPSSAPSSAAPSSAASSAAPPASPSAALTSPGAAATVAPAAGQLTGTELASVLLPAADYPAGFTAPPSGPVTSGGSLTSGPAAYNLATISCATFIEHLGTAGFGETAMASGSVAASGQSSGQAYDQFVYQFGAASAASAFVTGIQALTGRCGSFTATVNGTSGTFSLSATPGASVAGHPALEVLQTGTLGTSKLVLDLLLCASGVDVFGAAGVGVGGAAAPALPAKETIIYNLMKRQAAAALLS